MRRAVIDQPGVRIILIGLALSLFFGLALRSQIAESRVQFFLNKSTDRLQKDFYIDYESAKVNLSRWGLPLPALVIQNIRLSPKSTLCQSSQIFVNELEVPISFSALIGVNKIIPRIRVKEIELRLSDVEDCVWQNSIDQKESKSTATVSEDSALKASESSFKNIFSNNTRAELREIYIEKLKIISKKKPDQPILLKQVNFELFYFQNRLSEVQIRSKISALKDAKSDVYFLNSDLIALFKAKDKNEIEILSSINGKLLDGDVQLFSHALSTTKKISYELTLERVSVKALSPLIEDLNIFKGVSIEKIPFSISLANNGEIYLADKTEIDSKFKNIFINIENGIVKINQLVMNYTDSELLIKPFEMSVESLSLSKLKNIEQFKNKLDSFDSMGELSGKLEYTNKNLYTIKGNVKNIKAVFSNRGRRDLQNVEHVDIELLRRKNELKLEASNFIINNENVNGLLYAAHNTDNLNTSAQLKISGVTLNNKIWEQFTFVEQSPRIEVLWNYKKSAIETHNLKISADKILLPGVKLESLSIDISHLSSVDRSSNQLNVNIKPLRLSTDSSFFENGVVSQILNPKNGFKLDTLNSSKTNMTLSGPNWKNINFNLESYFLSDVSSKSDTHLTLKGAVKYEAGLEAKLILQNRDSVANFDLSLDQDDKIVVKRAQ